MTHDVLASHTARLGRVGVGEGGCRSPDSQNNLRARTEMMRTSGRITESPRLGSGWRCSRWIKPDFTGVPPTFSSPKCHLGFCPLSGTGTGEDESSCPSPTVTESRFARTLVCVCVCLSPAGPERPVFPRSHTRKTAAVSEIPPVRCPGDEPPLSLRRSCTPPFPILSRHQARLKWRINCAAF